MSSRKGMWAALIMGMVVVALFVTAWAVGLIGFHYPYIIDDEPLHSPIKVVRIDGRHVLLQDDRTIEFENWMEGRATISEALSQSDFQIDLEPDSNGAYIVWGRQAGWICGTPWTQPIRIPLFKDTVYRNRRQCIGRAKEIEGQPEDQRNEANETF